MDRTRRFDMVAWWTVGVLSVVGLVCAGVMSYVVLSTMNWNLFGGNLDWSPGHAVVPKGPQIPPGMQMPQPQGPPPGPGSLPAGPQGTPPAGPPGSLPAGPQVPPPARLPAPAAPAVPAPPPHR